MDLEGDLGNFVGLCIYNLAAAILPSVSTPLRLFDVLARAFCSSSFFFIVFPNRPVSIVPLASTLLSVCLSYYPKLQDFES